jgi:hypothetical protein
MNKFIEILIGLILIVAPILVVLNVPLFFSWGPATVEFLKGGVVVFIVIVGLVFLFLGISDMRS